MLRGLLTMLLIGFLGCDRPPRTDASSPKQPATQHERFRQADSELNLAYKQAIANLDAPDKARLVAEEAAWIRLKESACKNPSRVIADSETCLLSYTAARTEYLLKVFPPNGDEKLEGEYLLDPEGVVRIQRTPSGYSFSISVTNYQAHTGQVFGNFVGYRKQFAWTNSDSAECQRDRSCCSLLFAFNNSGVSIEEQSCEYYHGANVTFSGFYRKAH